MDRSYHFRGCRILSELPSAQIILQAKADSPVLRSAIIRTSKRSFKGLNMEAILAPSSVGISELKSNPTAVLEASGNKPVAILNRNKPVGYMLTAAAWKKIHGILEDKELVRIAEERITDGKKPVKVNIDEL